MRQLSKSLQMSWITALASSLYAAHPIHPTIEDVEAYWDKRPCNLHHSQAPLASAQYFQEVEDRKYFVEPHIPDFAKFSESAGQRVLDVGCGMGTIGAGFARAGADYTGFELSEKSLELAKQKFLLENLKGRFVRGNAEALAEAFPGEQFDLIFSFGVIHHSPNPKKILAEMRRLIAPGGLLKVMIYAKNSWKQALINAGLAQPEAQSGCPIASCYSREELPELFEGFEIVDVQQKHIFPYQIEPYKNYQYVKEPWFESMPEDMFAALESSLGWHLCITARPL